MNQSTRIPRRARRAMVPGIDHLESRQLLSAATPATSTSLSVVPSPSVTGTLVATAAIADNDIWAVGRGGPPELSPSTSMGRAGASSRPLPCPAEG